MKNARYLLTFICLGITFFSFGQKDIAVIEKSLPMSAGTKNGFQVTIPDADSKDVIKTLKSWVAEQQKKVEMDDVTKSEIKVSNIIVPSIGEKPINIYFVIATVKTDVTVTGFIEMGDSFLSSTNAPLKYKDGENYIRRFAYRIEKNRITETYNTAQKTLTHSQNDQADLEKEKNALNDDIIAYQKKIDNAKNDLEVNAKNQEAKKKEIADNQKSVDDIAAQLKLYDGY